MVEASKANPCRCCAVPASEDPIERGYIARITRGNAALEREVLALFLAHMPLCLERLGQALSASAWSDATHTIKGSAAAVGARRLARAAARAERIDSADATARQEAIAAVSGAAAEVCRHIAELTAR